MRIVSLVPSATEIVCALGLRGSLVGRSHECNYPTDVADVPVMTYTTLGCNLCPDDPVMSAAEIDAQVTARARDGLVLNGLNMDALEAAKPDLIITQGLSGVCAVSHEAVRDAVRDLSAKWVGRRTQVLSLEPTSLEGIFQTISAVGHLTEESVAADAIVGNLRARVDNMARLWVTASHKPTVAALAWMDPPFGAGHWVPEQIEMAGGLSVLGEAGQPAQRMTWDDVLASQPEMVVCMPCGYGLAGSVDQFMAVSGRDEWKELPAPYLNQLVCVDADAYFSRPGPRVVDGIELLAGLLHPDRVPPPAPSRAVRVLAFPLDQFIHGLP